MDHPTGPVTSMPNEDEALAAAEADVQQTREDISQTLEAIQDKLAPEQLTGDAKDAAIETVDHMVAEVRTTAQELSEIASVAAMEAVDHALDKLREVLPQVTEQLQESAKGASESASLAAMEAVDHAVAEVKGAVRELGDQARASVRDATIGRVERMADSTNQATRNMSTTIVQTIRQNPGPAALTALGIGWLVTNGRGATSTSTGSQGSSGVTDKVGSAVDQAQSTAGQAVDATGEKLGQATDQVTSMASGVAEGVTDAAGTVAGGVAGTATSVASGVQSTVAGAGHQAKAAPGRLRQMVDTNPLGLGLAAVAVGSVAALLVPETRRENELLGEARDTLVERAQTTAQSTLNKVQQVAEEVGETVEKESRYQGLTGDNT